jgi:hypothetical protein
MCRTPDGEPEHRASLVVRTSGGPWRSSPERLENVAAFDNLTAFKPEDVGGECAGAVGADPRPPGETP